MSVGSKLLLQGANFMMTWYEHGWMWKEGQTCEARRLCSEL